MCVAILGKGNREVIDDHTVREFGGQKSDKADELTGHGILVLIDEIFRHVLLHEFICRLGHPCVDEGGKIEERGSVEGELVVDHLVGRFCICALFIRVSSVCCETRKLTTYLRGDLVLGEGICSIATAVDGGAHGGVSAREMSGMMLSLLVSGFLDEPFCIDMF